MHSLRRAGLTGLSAALALLSVLPAAMPAAADGPHISIADSSATEGDKVVFTVTVTGDHATFDVDYATTPIDALDTVDFTPTRGTLRILDTDFSAKIRVPTVQDNIDEPDERFTISLSNTTATIDVGSATGSILDDDAFPVLNIGDASVSELDNATDTVDAIFDVSLDRPSSQDVTVRWATADDSAVGGGVDYNSKSAKLTFPAGTNVTQQVAVKVKGDTLHEGREQFLVNLSNPLNAVIGDGQGVGTIRDNDPVPTLSVSSTDFLLNEGNGLPINIAMVRASLSNPTVDTVTFTDSTSVGTPNNGDYTAQTNAARTIAAGQTGVFIPVTITGDTKKESDEYLYVVLASPVNAVLGNSIQKLVIQNDD